MFVNVENMKSLAADRLMAWYQENKRELAFRKDRDPYKIWVSEIMAQQTRIEAMLPYFERFIEKYPDPRSLAEAADDDLMLVWQGLGYYSRVRNMKKAAIQICEEYGGRFPSGKKELQKLAGIGDYTAGAIASIAQGQRASAVDGNVIRVFCRLNDIDLDPSVMRNRKKIISLVEDSLPEAEACGDYNQALMELGALICIPKTPRCAECPLFSFCRARENGTVSLRPVPKAKKERTKEKKDVWIWLAEEDGEIYTSVRKRPDSGLLAGLYEFECERPDFVLAEESLGEYTHVFTHKEWVMKGYAVRTIRKPDFVKWKDLTTEIALPSAFLPFYQRVSSLLKEKKELSFRQDEAKT